MTIHGSVTHVGGHLPDSQHMLRDLDHRARQAADQAARDAVAVARAGAPGSFAGDSMQGRVAKVADGYQVTIAPVKKRAYIARFVTAGTGVFGPKKKPIRRRKRDANGDPLPFKIGGSYYETFKGQKPNPFIKRNRARALAAAERAITNVGLKGGSGR